MDGIWISIHLAIIFILIVIIALLMIRLRKIRRENITGKFKDEDTGIGNLKYFQYHFHYTLGDIARNRYYVSYIVLDTSYLETYYKQTSFEGLLKYTADVLNKRVEEDEFVARITESGFALAIRCTDDQAAEKRFREILEELNDFEQTRGNHKKMVFHGAYYHLQNSDKNCEVLLFTLRENCNRICGTDQLLETCDIHSINKIQEEKKATEDILRGFRNHEFQMYLQFCVDNKTKKIVSAEALSRWMHPEKGLILPGKYIGNMERSNLISQHDFYMFELVCRQLAAWHNTEFSQLAISCNFTRITLSEENFVDKLREISDRYEFDRSCLAIEITEDAMEKNLAVATRNVQKCKELSFIIYLDDMGSGYTTLANLCDYPIDVVKIDRSILLKTDTKRGKELFSGIMALAHNLTILVIGEGVETKEQEEWISSTDCDFVQGWYYSKPLPSENAEDFLRAYQGEKLS